jgi:hypothetical protein
MHIHSAGTWITGSFRKRWGLESIHLSHTERTGGSRAFPAVTRGLHYGVREHTRTTAAIQGYPDELAGLTGESPAESVVRELLERSAPRLHALCGALLFRSYPRLTRPPLNLGTEEILSAVVERLLKALREHPARFTPPDQSSGGDLAGIWS